jgi:hypothetical protein
LQRSLELNAGDAETEKQVERLCQPLAAEGATGS